MEGLTIETPSLENSDNYSYWGYDYINNFDYKDYSSSDELDILSVVLLTIISLELLITLVAILAVFSLVKHDYVAPVYVINLLLSDLVRLSSAIPLVILTYSIDWINYIHLIGLRASVGFMLCVSLERYLFITKPLWYRFKQNLKTSLRICVVIWVFAVISGVVSLNFDLSYLIASIIMDVIFYLPPFVLLIFFLVGTIRALTAAVSVPADEKRRIVAIQMLVLLIYTLLFLPMAINLLLLTNPDSDYSLFFTMSVILLYVSPIADSTMYILLRKSIFDKVLASSNCCKMSNNEQQINTIDSDMMGVDNSVPLTDTV